jgi:hypothetical protein
LYFLVYLHQPQFVGLVEDPNLVGHALGGQELFHVRCKLEQLLKTIPKGNQDTQVVFRGASGGGARLRLLVTSPQRMISAAAGFI